MSCFWYSLSAELHSVWDSLSKCTFFRSSDRNSLCLFSHSTKTLFTALWISPPSLPSSNQLSNPESRKLHNSTPFITHRIRTTRYDIRRVHPLDPSRRTRFRWMVGGRMGRLGYLSRSRCPTWSRAEKEGSARICRVGRNCLWRREERPLGSGRYGPAHLSVRLDTASPSLRVRIRVRSARPASGVG